MSESENRGRIQAQGGGVEKSKPWARSSPLPAPTARDMLSELKMELSSSERKKREQGFEQATKAVDRAEQQNGVPSDDEYPWSKSFPMPPRHDARRVDLEVWAGKAFVPKVT